MSKIIASAAISGAHKLVGRARTALETAINQHGDNHTVEFPDTAYYLPVIYALLGKKVTKIGDMKEVLQEADKLLPPIPAEKLWYPYLGDALDAGIAALFAEEIIEALRCLEPGYPQAPYIGFTTDGVLREQGIKLVDGRMPGFAACIGALPDNQAAVKLARDLQERNILVFMAGSTNGTSIAEQLHAEGVQMDWDTFLVPYGKDITAAVLALGFAARAAMTFGGIQPGSLRKASEILLYNKDRVHAFVLALGEVDDEKYATAAGAINFGFPVIADTGIPQILPTGICTYEHVVSGVSHDDMPQRAIEVRGLKLKVDKIPIPVRYGPAFEGERVRKENLAVEFGGKYHTSFEYLQMDELANVDDGRIEVVGGEIDSMPERHRSPLAIMVKAAGRKMQKDFESILERYIHTFLSEPMGVMHLGQRDINWIRISKDAQKSGFKIHHLGVILRHKLLSEFPSIVDKVQVTIYTNDDDVQRLHPLAKAAYEERDTRLGQMTDESVEEFYSCALCQSYAPVHVCIITPQRLGLCGAYNWLDGKAAYEINPHGGNQPVKKGECYDPMLGKFRGVDKFVTEYTDGAFDSFSLYSMINEPMTSCGCFECIAAILPGTGGIMVVDRDYHDMTPVGMTFSSLAELVGGGQQTPGFIGIGTLYIISKKFISAEGGLKRLVWLTTGIKNKIRDSLEQRCREEGVPDLLDKIADETITTDIEELAEWLIERGHPALEMGEMM
ncbi:MAG: CO dehydrogenase/CO-methylating acetyl-CoA synthase complex subunit beta [candidate division Zixibacteria bacterium]|nr:CO dehydrogenase/CO-methylating acetyl-CoA synthase complex subunit beta [Candidatus Tariuqbacter arcticus]